MKRFFTVVALLLAAFVVSAQYSPCYYSKVKQGNSLFDQGKYEDAKKCYLNAKTCPHPNTAEVDKLIEKCNKKLYGPTHPFVIPKLDEKMVLNKDMGKFELDLSDAWLFLTVCSAVSKSDDEDESNNYLYLLDLLEMEPLPIQSGELLNYKKVRSFQIRNWDDSKKSSISLYPYFNCRFFESKGDAVFEKNAGSQRKSGRLYRKDENTVIFLGGAYADGEAKTKYGGDGSVFGTLYKLSPSKIIMLFWYSDGMDEIELEVYEFSK